MKEIKLEEAAAKKAATSERVDSWFTVKAPAPEVDEKKAMLAKERLEQAISVVTEPELGVVGEARNRYKQIAPIEEGKRCKEDRKETKEVYSYIEQEERCK